MCERTSRDYNVIEETQRCYSRLSVTSSILNSKENVVVYLLL